MIFVFYISLWITNYFFSGWFLNTAIQNCWEINVLFFGQHHGWAIALLVLENLLSLAELFASLLTGQKSLDQLLFINFFALRGWILIKNYFHLGLVMYHILIRLVQSVEILNLNILFLTTIISGILLLCRTFIFHHLGQFKI